MRSRVLFLSFCLASLVFSLPALCAEGGVASGSDSGASVDPSADSSWFRSERSFNLGAVVSLAAAFFYLVYRGRRGKVFYIRPISGIEAIEDAVGRAAEMGRPIAYIPGLSDVSDPATAASMSIMSKVAERAARLRCRINVPNFSPLTLPVARSVVEDAFLRAGRREDYSADDIIYLTSRHMTYTMAVMGMMTRQRVAASFLIGHFYSESLMLAETGASVGAMQIGGSDAVSQLPFLITTCDYTLIGEELFAAGALVGGDSVNRSTIVAHDWFKAAVIGILIFSLALMILDAAGVSGAASLAEAMAGFMAEGK